MENVHRVNVKVYFEGLEVPVNSVTVTSGPNASAHITLTKNSKYIRAFKPGTLCHVFIFWKDTWRIFFVGKMTVKTFSKESVTIGCISLFSELSKAVIAPISLGDTAYGHAIPMLNVTASEKVFNQGDQSEVLAVYDTGQIEFFNFEKLEKTGSVPEYIDLLLRAAKMISPWYRVQSDTMKLNESYYVLDNPNIFPITQRASVASLIKSVYQKIGTSIDYHKILMALLHQLRYSRFELNTPVKIDGEWKWVFLLPDTTWLEPQEFYSVEKNNTRSINFDEQTANTTRVLLHAESDQPIIDAIQQNRLKLLFASADEKPYKESQGVYAINYTEEEKYSGVRQYVVNLDDRELYYTLVNWEKSLDSLRTEDVTKNVQDTPTKLADYFAEMADYKFNQLKGSALMGTQMVPIYNPEIVPMFPVRISLFDDFSIDAIVDNIVYTIDADGAFNMDLVIGFARYSDTKRISLRWDPNEYKDDKIKDYYKKFFENRELMTEEEYWEWVGVTNFIWRRASDLNATVIANLPIKYDLLDYSLKTPLVYERAVPIRDYLLEAFGIERDLPLVASSDMNDVRNKLFSNYQGPIKTAGRTVNAVDLVREKQRMNEYRAPIKMSDIEAAKNYFYHYKFDIMCALNDAAKYLDRYGPNMDSSVDGVRRNISSNIYKVREAIEKDDYEGFIKFYAMWVMQESSWKPSAVNLDSNFGMYQINIGHDDCLQVPHATEYGYPNRGTITSRMFMEMSIREQTFYVAIISRNFNYDNIINMGTKVLNNTYDMWCL